MKTDFIHINSIDDIDTSKISIYDLNKRYIDTIGNMYGLRYNRDSRKVEIIRLYRTTLDRVGNIKKKIVEIKKNEYIGKIKKGKQSENYKFSIDSEDDVENKEEFKNSMSDVNQETMGSIPKEYEQNSKLVFNPTVFVNQLFKDLEIQSDRIRGMINNIQNSNLVDNKDKEEYIKLSDIMRNMEIDGFKKAEKIRSEYKEITEYPRSLNYYLGRIDMKGKDIVSSIYEDSKKMKYVLFYEMNNQLTSFYKKIQTILEETVALIDPIYEKKKEYMSSQQNQKISDAKITITNTLYEIKNNIEKLKELNTYINNSENFI